MWRGPCAICLLILLGGCGLLRGSPPAPADVLKPGDPLRIAVVGEEELSGVFTVDEDRTVHLPLVGNVPAGGLSLATFEVLLREKLADGYLKDPQLLVARDGPVADPAVLLVVAPATPLPILPVLRPSQSEQ